MDQLRVLFFKYRKVLKNAILLCAVFIAIFSKEERVKSLSLGAASGILIIELGDSVNRAIKANTKKVSGE